jgi:hypothetical protein
MEKLQFLGAAIGFFAAGTLMVLYENFRIRVGRPILNVWHHCRGSGYRPMAPGQMGWFVAVAAIGIAIWFFKVYRKRPPQ